MRSILTTSLVCLGLAAAAGTRRPSARALEPARADDDGATVDEVRAAERALDRALRAGDTAALGRLYADGYVHVNQFGERTGKMARLAELGSGARRVEAGPPPADEQFAVFGDVVVTSARTQGRQTLRGEAVGGGQRLGTRVWIKRAGRWQVALAQTTPIRPRAELPR